MYKISNEAFCLLVKVFLVNLFMANLGLNEFYNTSPQKKHPTTIYAKSLIPVIENRL